MHFLQHSGYCYQLYHWSKCLRHSCNLFPQRLTTHIIWHPFYQVQLYYFSKKGRELKFIQVTFPNCPRIQGKTLEQYQKFSLILHLWYCYEELSHYYLGIYLQYSSTLVQHFQYFVVLVYVQHSCKICWDPLWFFISCFILIFWFTLKVCENSC